MGRRACLVLVLALRTHTSRVLQGHVGASPGGLVFLEQEYIVPSIVEIAEDSPVYSLRG
jgi:hypothetical protein